MVTRSDRIADQTNEGPLLELSPVPPYGDFAEEFPEFTRDRLAARRDLRRGLLDDDHARGRPTVARGRHVRTDPAQRCVPPVQYLPVSRSDSLNRTNDIDHPRLSYHDAAEPRSEELTRQYPPAQKLAVGHREEGVRKSPRLIPCRLRPGVPGIARVAARNAG